MEAFETDATIDTDGGLTLERLPFASGQAVRVRIEQKAEVPAQRVLGLHEGMVWMSDDFDEPLPDAFWLGQEGVDESSA
jgi:hypothetical protein